MSEDRTYSEAEIAAIFERASKDQEEARQKKSDHQGLSLSELKEIGRQSGIDPDLISRAAASMERVQPTAPQSSILGFKTSVFRVVDIDGRLTDDDWGRLVVEMREIFHAHGKTEQHGGFKSWRNGNLRITLEPTEFGHRLRMNTKKGNAGAIIAGSIVATFMLLLTIFATMLFADPSADFISVRLLVLLLFAGGLGLNLAQLPRWVKQRGEQMDALGVMANVLAQKSSLRKSVEIDVQHNTDKVADVPDRIDSELLSQDDVNDGAGTEENKAPQRGGLKS